MTTIALNDLTTGTLVGEGIFDKLMTATKAHLEAEFNKNRIKGPEYATVYLGSMTAVMNTALQFLLMKEKAGLEADLIGKQIALTEQQTINAVAEHAVLVAQECKLRAEYDLLMLEKLKTSAETTLLGQRTETEKAQIQSLGVDDNSVIGKQKALFSAQTEGFKRNAEQRAAELMLGSWNARRMTDDATQANTTNMLDDTAVGRSVTKLLGGVGA